LGHLRPRRPLAEGILVLSLGLGGQVAFRLKRGESLRHAVKRMARHELEDAREALGRHVGSGDGAGRAAREGIHDARTALKRVRALIGMVAPGVGRPARHACGELRALGRKLSLVRDAEVLLATFDRVRRAVPRTRDPQLTEARRTLEALLREREAGVRPQQRGVSAKLARARREVGRWAPNEDRWRALSPGLVNGYRRCRRRMRAAYADGTPEAFHAWRRAVKTHRYQMQALESLWPTELEAQRRDLEKLGDLLGEEHDLAVLADTLREERTCFADNDTCSHFLAALEQRQRDLRSLSLPIGERLFAEKAGGWGRRHRAYFRSFRSEAPGTGAEAMAPSPAV
jgi:CHAD domain-containing protein